MIYNNIKLIPPEPSLVVIGHGEQDIVLKARVLNTEDWAFHDKVNPAPAPIQKNLPGGKVEFDSTSPEYRAKFEEYVRKRIDFSFVRALDCNPDFSIETVKIDDSSTWGNYRDEMLEAGFTDQAIASLFMQVNNINSFDSARVEKAKKDFLATR